MSDPADLTFKLQFRRPADGTPTGFPLFDNQFGRLMGGELTLLAARPAVGKTTVLSNVLYNAAVKEMCPTLLFSLELRAIQLARLFMDIHGGARFTETSHAAKGIMGGRFSIFRDAPLFVDDTPAISIDEIKGKASRFIEDYGPGIIAVDYLQLIQSGLDGFSDHQSEMKRIASELKALSKELDVPIVVCFQLLEKVGRTADRKESPSLRDMRDDESIVDAADKVLVLRDNPIPDKDGFSLMTGRKTLFPVKGYAENAKPITFYLGIHGRRITEDGDMRPHDSEKGIK